MARAPRSGKTVAASAPAAAPAAAALNLDALRQIVEATRSEQGFSFEPEAVYKPFLEHNPPLVEVNADMADDNGWIATRATDAGLAYFDNGTAPTAEAPAPAGEPAQDEGDEGEEGDGDEATAAPEKVGEVNGFAVFTGVKPPKQRRNRPEKYPFTKLEVNQGFFVPGETDADGNPVNMETRMTSARGQAQARIRKDTGEERKFSVFAYTTPDGVEGVMVTRIK